MTFKCPHGGSVSFNNDFLEWLARVEVLLVICGAFVADFVGNDLQDWVAKRADVETSAFVENEWLSCGKACFVVLSLIGTACVPKLRVDSACDFNGPLFTIVLLLR